MKLIKNLSPGISLVVQWLRRHAAKVGSQVPSLVRDRPHMLQLEPTHGNEDAFCTAQPKKI